MAPSTLPGEGHAVHGQCHCGDVQLHIREPLAAPIICHCGLCRRLSGAAFTTWVSVKKSAFEVTGASRLTTYQATSHLTRHFCTRCGTHLYTSDDRYPDIEGVYGGILEDADVKTPAANYFVSDKASWYALPADANCFGGATGFEPINN